MYNFVKLTENVFNRINHFLWRIDVKETGVVRRIDELGRIVIPKEIRRIEKMKEGTPVEIFVNAEGDVVLKKFSPIFELQEFATDICQSVADVTEYGVLLCDLEKVIAVSNASKGIYNNKAISPELEALIAQRKNYMGNARDGSSILKIIDGDSETYSAQIITPVVFDGDVGGAIILFRKEGDLSVAEVNISKVFASFIARQMV